MTRQLWKNRRRRHSRTPFGQPHHQRRAAVIAGSSALLIAAGLLLTPSAAQASGDITIEATVVAGGDLSLHDAWSTQLPASLKAADASIPVGGSGTWSATGPKSASGEFGYRIYEHGQKTDYTVSGEAHYVWPDTPFGGACSIFRDDPATGAPVRVDQATDSPYECTASVPSDGSLTDFEMTFTVQPLIWSTARGVVVPVASSGHSLSLADGALSSSNREFLVNGALHNSGSAPDAVAAGASTGFAAFLRNAEGNELNGWARGDFTYRIVEDGVATPFWVQGHVQNTRSTTFKHDATCSIFQGNPIPGPGEDPGTLVEFSPYTCDPQGENLDGRGDWQVTFTLQATPYTLVSGAEATELLNKGCVEGTSCIFFPKSKEDILKGDPVNVGSQTNDGTEGSDTLVYEYHDDRSISNSLAIAIGWKGKSDFLIEELESSLKITYKFKIEDTTGHVWSHKLDVPPRTTVSAWLTPAYTRVTGDFFFEAGGKFFRAADTQIDLPNPQNPGHVEKKVQHHLGAVLPDPLPDPGTVTVPPGTITPVPGTSPDAPHTADPVKDAPAKDAAVKDAPVKDAAKADVKTQGHALAHTGANSTVLALSAGLGLLVILAGSYLLVLVQRRRTT